MPDRGLLVVISGPSGSGKGTVIRKLFSMRSGFFFSVSATTRAARPGEVEGREYYFLSKEEFERQIDDGNMLEYAQYCGNYYGTPRSAVEERRNMGLDVVLDIEVQGANNIRRTCPDAVLIFLKPPSPEELERRLRKRGTESDEVIRKRLSAAKQELAVAQDYNYIVTNDDVARAAGDIISIITAEKLRPSRQQ